MRVDLKKTGIYINGKPEVMLCASLFYFRIPPKEWEARAKLLSSLGYNCVDIYFPWNFHETSPDMFDFTGERDIEKFLQICKENELYVIARPGPYICSEWDGGALPSWVIHEHNIRQNDVAYLLEVKKWFQQIMPILAKYQIDRAGEGSIILLQLDNELDFFDCQDVEGYIGQLKQLALDNNGITVPLFACAGQGDIKRSGGLTKGVVPTYNFYPTPSDKSFDSNMALYAEYIQNKGYPFLVTETDRKHCILKRELLSGAKLLGAYNQVSGSNFGYYQSINNWGDLLSLICTLYDFDGMIDNLGHCTKEADEALLLSEAIHVYGSKLASALYEAFEVPIYFDSKDVGFSNGIALDDDSGKLICVRSVADKAVQILASYHEHTFDVSLEAFEAVA